MPAMSNKNKAVCVACRARKKRCSGQKPACSSCINRQETCSYPPSRPMSSSAAVAQSPFAWCQPFMPASPFHSYLTPSSLQLNSGITQTLPELSAVTAPNQDQYSMYPASMMGASGATAPSSSSLSSPPATASSNGYATFGSSMGGEEPTMFSAFNNLATPGPETWLPTPMASDLGSSDSSTTASVFEDFTKTPNQQPSQHLLQTALSGDFMSQSDQATLSSNKLPTQEQLDELIDVFFERFYIYMPMFYRKRFPTAIGLSGGSPVLLFSVLALVAGSHPDPHIRSLQGFWGDKAKSLYGSTTHQPQTPLPTLQAAACIVLHALIIGDHSTAWLVLGKAWRQAVALGLHQTDSSAPSAMPGAQGVGSSLSFTDWAEHEESRRTMWTLFILDRGMCFPIGLAHTIDERQLRINLPMDEESFQHGDSAVEPSGNVLFTPNFRRLLTSVGDCTRKKGVNMLHYMVLTYMLLGRIIEYVYSAEADLDDQQSSNLNSLQEDLSQMRLMLPRSATNLASALHADCNHVVWLNVLMNVNAIFLFHRPQKLTSIAGGEDRSDGSSWHHCVAVARNTTTLIREASRVSTDLIVNPNIAAPAFTCARILIVEQLISPATLGGSTSASSALEADLQVLLLMFDRLSEAFSGVGAKFRDGVLYHLRQGPGTAREIKAAGSKDLLTSCGKWQPSMSEG